MTSTPVETVWQPLVYQPARPGASMSRADNLHRRYGDFVPLDLVQQTLPA
jgi:hypothetical protein